MTRPVDDILGRATVADVLRFAGRAVPDNRRQLMHCPLPGHRDSSPSFKLVDETGWVCFGCGRRGGVLQLVCELELARDLAEAARWLRARLGGFHG